MADFNEPMNASQWASRQLGYKGAFGSGQDTAYKQTLNPAQQKQHATLMSQYGSSGVNPTTVASQNQYQQQALYNMGQPSKPIDSRIDSSLGPNAYKQYMNPYLEDVIGRNASNINRQYDVQRNRINEDMAAAGGFGSSAQGVERALTGEAEARQIGDMDAQLRSQGFNTANDLAMRNASAYMDLDRYGRQVTQGDQDRQLYAGDRIQNQNQAVLDAYYRERDRAAGYDNQVLDWYTQLLGRMPGGQTTTGTQSGVGAIPGAIGGGLLGNAIYNNLGGRIGVNRDLDAAIGAGGGIF